MTTHIKQTTEKQIAKLLKDRRLNLNYTIDDVAELSGVSPVTIYKWERATGGKMSPKNALIIENTLKLKRGVIYDIYNEDCNDTNTTTLRKYRLLNGFTMSEVAKKLGVLEDTVANWELNKTNPSGIMISAMAKLYRTTPNILLDFNESG